MGVRHAESMTASDTIGLQHGNGIRRDHSSVSLAQPKIRREEPGNWEIENRELKMNGLAIFHSRFSVPQFAADKRRDPSTTEPAQGGESRASR